MEISFGLKKVTGMIIFSVFLFLTSCNMKLEKTSNQQEKEIKNTLIELNNRDVYISYEIRQSENHDYPVLMAIHGSGREARSYMPADEKSVDFYIYQQDLALQNGYMFVVLSNGIDTWGTDTGLRNLKDLYEFIQSNYQVQKKWTLWATSAGGTMMNRFIRKYPERVNKALGTFPVYDISDSMKRSNGAKEVWSDRQEELQKRNPSRYPEVLTRVPFLIFHGKDDEVVPPEFHSEILKKEVNDLGGDVTLYLVEGGHSTSNWNVYDDKIITDFLQQ